MSLIKLKNNALDNLTSFEGSASLGDMVLVSSATASSSASIEFSLGSYKEYKFFFVNIHPATNNVAFSVNFSTDSGSNYNVTKTTTFVEAYHAENNSSAALVYNTGADLAQSTSDALVVTGVGGDADECCSGYLHLFNPSSDTFVKHFITMSNNYNHGSLSVNQPTAGYCNTTSPLTNIRFKFSSGNIDDGKILMFGLN